MNKKIVWAIAVLLGGFLGWKIVHKLIQGSGGHGPDGAGVVAVVVEPVRRESIRDAQTFTGTVYPRTQFVVAPKVSGRLEKLLVNIGSEVRSGDLIAQLDDQEYRQQVEQARAELDVARANVADARSTLDIAARELDRVKALRAQQVASESELDRAEASSRTAAARNEVALAQVKQREAALKASEVRLSYTQISAAWNNRNEVRVVGERFVDEGAMLGANQPIVSVLDLDIVIASIYVIERDYPNIRIGQTAMITTDAFPQRAFKGTILRKAPLLREASRQALVEIEVPNTDRLLTPGMFVRAEIEFAKHDEANIVPSAAVVRRDGKPGVFLADTEAGKARFVPVTLGIIHGERSEIADPPLSGRVVTMGQHLLDDGTSILISTPTTPGRPAEGERDEQTERP